MRPVPCRRRCQALVCPRQESPKPSLRLEQRPGVSAKGVDSYRPPNPIRIVGYGVEVSHPLFFTCPKVDPTNKSDVQLSLVGAGVSYLLVARSCPFVLARPSTYGAAY